MRSSDAEEDLIAIWRYVAHHNPSAAEKLWKTFDRNFDNLSDMPGMSRSREELGEGIRSFPVGNYLIFYRPIPGVGIAVLRVLHGARDIEQIFHEE